VTVPESTFALRYVRRPGGDAAVVYRRALGSNGKHRYARLGEISPLAYTAGAVLLCDVRQETKTDAQMPARSYIAVDDDAGARVACYALIAAGLRDAERLGRAAASLRHADGTEAAWWLGLMADGRRVRAVRALRILVEAVA
jgi:hypothetical protein